MRAEASTVNEVIETFKLKHAETESKIGLLTIENDKMKKDVYLCKAKVNAMMKRVENFHNLLHISMKWLSMMTSICTEGRSHIIKS